MIAIDRLPREEETVIARAVRLRVRRLDDHVDEIEARLAVVDDAAEDLGHPMAVIPVGLIGKAVADEGVRPPLIVTIV
jgi:hypothetical protein